MSSTTPAHRWITKQADSDERFDIGKLQNSYADIIEEKNNVIRRLEKRLAAVTPIDTLSGADLSRELTLVTPNVGAVSLSKHTTYNNGIAEENSVVALVRAVNPNEPIDLEKIRLWLSVRTKNGNVKVIQE